MRSTEGSGRWHGCAGRPKIFWRCLAKRVPCLANSIPVAARPRRRGDRRQGQGQPSWQLSHLRCPPCLPRPARRRHLLRPASGRTAHAGAGAAGSAPSPWTAQGSRGTLDHCRQRAGSPVHCRQAQPEVGGCRCSSLRRLAGAARCQDQAMRPCAQVRHADAAGSRR